MKKNRIVWIIIILLQVFFSSSFAQDAKYFSFCSIFCSNKEIVGFYNTGTQYIGYKCGVFRTSFCVIDTSLGSARIIVIDDNLLGITKIRKDSSIRYVIEKTNNRQKTSIDTICQSEYNEVLYFGNTVSCSSDVILPNSISLDSTAVLMKNSSVSVVLLSYFPIVRIEILPDKTYRFINDSIPLSKIERIKFNYKDDRKIITLLKKYREYYWSLNEINTKTYIDLINEKWIKRRNPFEDYYY